MSVGSAGSFATDTPATLRVVLYDERRRRLAVARQVVDFVPKYPNGERCGAVFVVDATSIDIEA